MHLNNPSFVRDIVVLHLADNVENLLGYSIILQGNIDEFIEVKGRYL